MLFLSTAIILSFAIGLKSRVQGSVDFSIENNNKALFSVGLIRNCHSPQIQQSFTNLLHVLFYLNFGNYTPYLS